MEKPLNHIHWILSRCLRKQRKIDASSSSPHAKTNTDHSLLYKHFFFLISSARAHPSCSYALPGSMTSHNLPGRLMQPENQKKYCVTWLISTYQAILNKKNLTVPKFRISRKKAIWKISIKAHWKFWRFLPVFQPNSQKCFTSINYSFPVVK